MTVNRKRARARRKREFDKLRRKVNKIIQREAVELVRAWGRGAPDIARMSAQDVVDELNKQGANARIATSGSIEVTNPGSYTVSRMSPVPVGAPNGNAYTLCPGDTLTVLP